MKQGFYSLPLRLDAVMEGRDLQQCSLEESIHQHVHLILTTSFGEMQFDESFGCIIWDTDFDNLTTVNKMRDKIKESVVQVVQQYETRIEKLKVEVYIRQEELKMPVDGRQVKKRIDLRLDGILKATRTPYSFADHFFIGPLSY